MSGCPIGGHVVIAKALIQEPNVITWCKGVLYKLVEKVLAELKVIVVRCVVGRVIDVT